MFDSQKLSAQSFITGLKHGVYIIGSDSCQICADYKAEIEHINNHYLYFVEVADPTEKNIIFKMTNRAAFPMTVGCYDNEIRFVRLGQLFGKDWREIQEFLEQFGDAPLTDEEVKTKIHNAQHKCELAYYLFPPETDAETRKRVIQESYKHDELAIDVDTWVDVVSGNETSRLFDGNLFNSKVVIFDSNICDNYSHIGLYLIGKVLSINGKIEYRSTNG